MAKEKVRSFNVQALSREWVAIEIQAKDLSAALEKAGTLKDTDFVDYLGDVIDGDFRITGIYESDGGLDS